jgi:hypothetical protein
MRTSAICRQWTVGVVGALAACAVAVATGCDSPKLAAPASPSIPASTAPAAGSSSPDTGAPGSPSGSPAPAGTGCAAADLAYQAQTPGAAAGNYYDQVRLVSHGSVACQLAGYPALYYTDASGTVRPVPTLPEPAGNASPYTVASGGSVAFTIHTVNGYGAYDPSDPRCAHPMLYRGLSVQVSGARVPLGDVVIDLKCGDILLSSWGAPSSP